MVRPAGRRRTLRPHRAALSGPAIPQSCRLPIRGGSDRERRGSHPGADSAAHWDAFYPHLEAEGVDVKAAQGRGQLTVIDADKVLPSFMQGPMPDAPVFLGLAGEAVARARGAGRYPRVGWWGEMVNILWERGKVAASMGMEDLFDQFGHKQEIAIFCSFVMDNFNGEVTIAHAAAARRKPLAPDPRGRLRPPRKSGYRCPLRNRGLGRGPGP